MKLGEAMVKAGLITNDVLARALERQIIFGGRLGTNLVEMGAVTEESLAKFLGGIMNVPYAGPDYFANVQQEALDAFPADLAEKYTAFPLSKERSRLHLAMKDPNDFAALDELRFIVGTDIKAYIASEIRIIYALDKYYGIKKDMRYVPVFGPETADDKFRQALITEKQLRKQGTPVIKPPEPEEFLGDESQEELYGGHGLGAAGISDLLDKKPEPPPPPQPQGPATPVQAAPAQPAPVPVNPYESLANPIDRDHVAHALVAAAREVLGRAALFLVKGNAVMGWKADVPGLAYDPATISMGLDAPGIFKDVVEDRLFYKGPILRVPQNVRLVESLGGAIPQEAIAYPLIIKGKVVAVLYGDNGNGALITGDIEKLNNLMTKASMSLEILILRNKILGG